MLWSYVGRHLGLLWPPSTYEQKTLQRARLEPGRRVFLNPGLRPSIRITGDPALHRYFRAVLAQCNRPWWVLSQHHGNSPASRVYARSCLVTLSLEFQCLSMP